MLKFNFFKDNELEKIHTTFDKYIFYVGMIIAVLFFLFVPLITFSLDNYRYTLSAALQSQTSIFAIIVTVTLLAFQLSSDKAPTSLNFFPKKTFLWTIVMIAAVMVLDGAVLVMLPEEITYGLAIILNTFLYINVLVLALVIHYIFLLLDWMSPQASINNLIFRSHQLKNNQERNKIVASLEELAWNAVHKGYTSTLELVIDTYSKLAEIYFRTNIELNTDRITQDHPEHPLREMPRSLERLAKLLLNNNMEGFVFLIARPLAIIAKESEDWVLPHSEMLSAAERIVIECLKKDSHSTLFNFIGEILYCIEGEESKLKNLAQCLFGIYDETRNYTNILIIKNVLTGFIIISKKNPNLAYHYCSKFVPDLKKSILLVQEKNYDINCIQDYINELEEILAVKWH